MVVFVVILYTRLHTYRKYDESNNNLIDVAIFIDVMLLQFDMA